MGKRYGFLVLANRLPGHRSPASAGGRRTWHRSTGGLVTAMEPVLESRCGLWLGWDGSVGNIRRAARIEGFGIASVALSASEIRDYYEGFSNSSLWPLYHDAVRTPQFHRSWWAAYQKVNERFARAADKLAAKKATVWVHDYHLQLVPGMLRERRPDLKIGFFLHIPFPPEELFAWLPWRSAMLRGMLGADVLGFQTQAGSQNFSRAARRWSQADGTDRELTFGQRTIHVRPFPIAIDTASFEATAQLDRVETKAEEIRASLAHRRMLLAVDRLDYTKGIPDRLSAFEELLREKRLSAEDCVMVQIAVPSREESPGYAETRREVEALVGRINGQFSEPGKVAVHYFRRSLSREDLVAYYRAADVMLVTPLRDGMNLVAKEYVACRHDLGGMLVLSEFAGAAWELRRALLVNPRDIDGVKSTIVQALRMRERDRRLRMAILRTQVKRHDVHDWAQSFLEALQ